MGKPGKSASPSDAPVVEEISRIVSLVAQNIKRLKAVRIRPDGAVVQITGRNAQGKSSVLDSIAMALGGKGSIPEAPIRNGKSKAKVIVDLGNMIVKRTWTDSGTYLSIEARNGSEIKSPQAVLDAMVGKLAFDPLAFSRMEPRRQAEIVKDVAGADFSKLDSERVRLYDERTEAGRRKKSAEARVEDLPTGSSKEIDVAALAAEHEAAVKAASDIEREKMKKTALFNSGTELKNTIARIEADLEEKKKQLDKIREDFETQKKVIDDMAEGLVDPAPIAERLKNAEKENGMARRRRASDEAFKQATAEDDEISKLTDAIEKIDVAKKEALAASKIPVKGMTFDENGVYLNGVPFGQASSSEQLRASVRMGLALNPKLRVLLVRDGSLLDSGAMAELAEIAEESDAQLWVERTTDGQAVGVVIEDGEVLGESTEEENEGDDK